MPCRVATIYRPRLTYAVLTTAHSVSAIQRQRQTQPSYRLHGFIYCDSFGACRATAIEAGIRGVPLSSAKSRRRHDDGISSCILHCAALQYAAINGLPRYINIRGHHKASCPNAYCRLLRRRAVTYPGVTPAHSVRSRRSVAATRRSEIWSSARRQPHSPDSGFRRAYAIVRFAIGVTAITESAENTP